MDAACRAAELGEAQWEFAEAARLVRVQPDRIDFVHPLARSAVYELANPDEQSAAHSALARSLPIGEYRTWHAAEAAGDVDEPLAAELTDLARAALGRGDPALGYQAAAKTTELSPTASHAAARHLLAAQCALQAGLDHRPHTRQALADGPAEGRAGAAQRPGAPGDWLVDGLEVACPDPEARLVMRIERTQLRRLERGSLA